MFKVLKRKNIHLFIHVFAISLVAIGMPFSKVLMSLGTILSLLNILIEADFKSYWNNLQINTTFKWIVLFILLHFVGFIWSTNYAYALNDIRTKSTIFILPLVLISKPLNHNNLKNILGIFVSSVFLSSMVNFLNYNHIIGNRNYLEIREMSLFGSHIRFSILIILSCTIINEYWKSFISIKSKSILMAIFVWFIFYTFYSQVLTGILALITAIIIISIQKLLKNNKILLTTFLSILFIIGVMLFNFLKPTKIEKIDISQLPKYSNEGNPYKTDISIVGFSENKPINISICDIELRREWEKKSTIPYDGRDSLNQRIRTTLIRYIASKKLSKDAVGISKLTNEDIKSIERGIANVHENNNGIIGRLYGLKYQLENNSNPNGHSLLQRLEYWKTATQIIQNNLLIGVGTGDVQIAFNKQYSLNKSKLEFKNRLRAHNLYLTNFVTFGILGLFSFIGLMFVFTKNQIDSKNLLGLLFISIFIITSLIEDTIETQLGATIFAFFIGLYSMNNSTKKLEVV